MDEENEDDLGDDDSDENDDSTNLPLNLVATQFVEWNHIIYQTNSNRIALNMKFIYKIAIWKWKMKKQKNNSPLNHTINTSVKNLYSPKEPSNCSSFFYHQLNIVRLLCDFCF